MKRKLRSYSQNWSIVFCVYTSSLPFRKDVVADDETTFDEKVILATDDSRDKFCRLVLKDKIRLSKENSLSVCEYILAMKRMLRIFKKILQDAIDAEWNEDIYYNNCPSKKYDYEAKGEEEPQDIDPDSVSDGSEDGLTIREKMYKKITEAFYQGWEIAEGYSNTRNIIDPGMKKNTS